MLISTGLLWAQGDTARLEGTVIDSSGASIPNASVLVVSQATARQFKVATAGAGSFTLPALTVGRYQILAEATGFKKYAQDVTLSPGQIANVTITLQTGDVTETVTITSEAALLDNASSEIGSTITSRHIEELPLNGRNFTQVALLTPGGACRRVTEPAATGIPKLSATETWEALPSQSTA